MKILIKGAGDLATGVAAAFYGAGNQILMTETAVPLTVRRMAAMSRAVYDGKAKIELMDANAEMMEGYLVHSLKEAEAIFQDGKIAILVDPMMQVREAFQPDLLVDAVLAKYNTGTTKEMAPIVIGLGPGFDAGTDCDAVIETMRGDNLGKIIYRGKASTNTGIPGMVAGYAKERLLRATGSGVITPCLEIGEHAEKGQIVAYTGGVPVYAEISGVVRGMLQPGISVEKGLKIGDIDPRDEAWLCWHISDKALKIGESVQQAVTLLSKE